MALFESLLLLLVVAVLLLQLSRHFNLPYPAMLALAGGCIAAFSLAPQFDIDPQLALTLFIAPVLLDAAYDTSPQALARNWIPLLALAVFAVLLTTFAVMWVGWQWGGLPMTAAFTLGAVVAPPDAAAASAVLKQFELPRRTVLILQGESLLNDAVALLLFSAALKTVNASQGLGGHTIPLLLIAPPGGALLGFALARLYLYLSPQVAGTLSLTIVEFVVTFGAWVIASHLHLSPIITIVVFAMTLAHFNPALQRARDRIHSYSVWESAVFVLNVLAFLLMGLQARLILSRIRPNELREDLLFALTILAIVIVVRMVWVMFYVAIIRRISKRIRQALSIPPPSVKIGLIASWSGMRGLVTLATAFALPSTFPARDQIVLTAFTVVIGTLVIQGLTLRPLIQLLRLEPDRSLNEETSRARTTMIDAAIATLAENHTPAAQAVRAEYEAARQIALDPQHPQSDTEHDRLRMSAIQAERQALRELRRTWQIDDDTFHRLEEELDWAELNATPTNHLGLLNT